MKLAVSGKGGVGKTTVTALLAFALNNRGQHVIAMDIDPDANLLSCMGYPAADDVRPLVDLKDLIEERTGVRPGSAGGLFKLNPRVEDIPAKYAVDIAGMKVLVAGRVKEGGTGCYCPENAFVRRLVSHLLLTKNTALIMDMEAGIEHLGRGTVAEMDALVVVVEPGRRSLETARRIVKLARDLGIGQIVAIGNKISTEAEKDNLRDALPEIAFIGFVPWAEELRDAEMAGRSAFGASDKADRAVFDAIKALAHSRQEACV